MRTGPLEREEQAYFSRIAFFTLTRLVAGGSLFFSSVSGIAVVQTSFTSLSCEEYKWYVITEESLQTFIRGGAWHHRMVTQPLFRRRFTPTGKIFHRRSPLCGYSIWRGLTRDNKIPDTELLHLGQTKALNLTRTEDGKPAAFTGHLFKKPLQFHTHPTPVKIIDLR